MPYQKAESGAAFQNGASAVQTEKPLKMREWELDSLKKLVEQLEARMQDVCGLRFFYSFQIPRLGKEFDLLQIKEDQIINIELKKRSGVG